MLCVSLSLCCSVCIGELYTIELLLGWETRLTENQKSEHRRTLQRMIYFRNVTVMQFAITTKRLQYQWLEKSVQLFSCHFSIFQSLHFTFYACDNLQLGIIIALDLFVLLLPFLLLVYKYIDDFYNDDGRTCRFRLFKNIYIWKWCWDVKGLSIRPMMATRVNSEVSRSCVDMVKCAHFEIMTWRQCVEWVKFKDLFLLILINLLFMWQLLILL